MSKKVDNWDNWGYPMACKGCKYTDEVPLTQVPSTKLPWKSVLLFKGTKVRLCRASEQDYKQYKDAYVYVRILDQMHETCTRL